MCFSETEVLGAFIIDLEPIPDDRRFFARAFSRGESDAHGFRLFSGRMRSRAGW
jgi:dTDP-4-dehydrorhamnose 3,5-epimerase-like enzyme